MKQLLATIIAISITSLSFAQVNSNALGLRFGGDGVINGAQISYQKGLNDQNRIELDLGFGASKNHSRMFLAGMYHWVWNIDGGLNWYVGPGVAVGLFSYPEEDDYINVSLGGQIGLEYDFNIKDAPILLSLDTRPLWDFIGDNAGFGWGVALGVRYTW